MLQDIINVSIDDALMITVFSMAIVFAALLIISLILDLFKAFLYKDPVKKEKKMDKLQNPIINRVAEKNEEDGEELVAVITAALAAGLSKPSSQIKIRNIKRVSQESPIWARTGRQEQVTTR